MWTETQVRSQSPGSFKVQGGLRQSNEGWQLDNMNRAVQTVSQVQAGIGLLMQQDLNADGEPDRADGRVFIKSVVPGGPCDRDGVVKPGDHMMAVNNQNVAGLTVATIREKILGPIGSVVRITLESATTGEIYHRDLVRGHVQSVDTVARGPRDSHDTSLYSTQPMLSHSIDTKRFSLSGLPPGAASNDTENARLKRRISELESNLMVSENEIHRLRSLLDNERRMGSAVVRDVDNMQRHNQLKVEELTTALNKSEQSRREMELIIAADKAREEEFQLAFTRAREQTEAREFFFGDIKTQFDEDRARLERELALSDGQKKDAIAVKNVLEEELSKARAEMASLKAKEMDRRARELSVRQLLNQSESKLIELRQLEEKVRGQSQSMHLVFAQWHKDYFLKKGAEETEMEQYFLGTKEVLPW